MSPDRLFVYVATAAVGLFGLYCGYLLTVVHLNNRRFRRVLKNLGGTGNDSGPNRTGS